MRLTGQRLLDRYLVGERIARGGMGIVFRGDDERLQRPVCVKVFLPLDPSRPEYATVLEHFVQEAFTLSRLTHPNTLRIYDFGYLDAVDRTGPFFVTEFADGGTLTDLVEARGTLTAAETLRILEPVVGALGEAHDASIVHRDIKPSNILFTRAGGGLMPKLCDFSIAKATGDLPHRAQDTNMQVPLYSLSWAAPEQLGGGAIGAGVDVFALGLMTLFMLTGHVVYPGDDLMRAYALRSEGEPARSATIRGAAPSPAVADVLLGACAESPEDRFPSVESFLDALREAFAVADQPSATEVVSSPAQDLDADGKASEDERSSAEPPDEATEAIVLGPLPVEPLRTATTSPLRVVQPPNPEPPPLLSPAPRPTLEINALAPARRVLGNRRVTLVEANGEVLTIPNANGGEPARIRITAMDVGGSRLHIKGLNCFVRAQGGRPSSGLDVKQSMTVELVVLPQAVAATLGIAVARQQGDHHVCDLPQVSLAVHHTLASWVVVFDLVPGPDAIVLYRL